MVGEAINRARPSFLTMSLVLALIVFCPTVPAQTAAGRIFGTITDQSGGAIGGVMVTVSNEDTHREYRAATGSDGFYQVLLLPLGAYRITVEKNAFQTMVVQGQVLQINQSLRIDVHFRVGP
jgi:Carboxypeptidase regulatory-like domain